MTTYFRTEKVGRTRTNIYDAATGEYLCQLMNREVADWLCRSEKAYTQAAEDAVTLRQFRAAKVEAYLAKRSMRPVQLALVF